MSYLVEEEQVQEVAEGDLPFRAGHVAAEVAFAFVQLKPRSWAPGTARWSCGRYVFDAGRAREQRDAELGHRAAAHFSEAHAQQHLVAGLRFLQPEQVDDVAGFLDVAGRDVHRLVGRILVGHDAGEHDRLAVALGLDRLAREQLDHLFVELREVALDDDFVLAADAAFSQTNIVMVPASCR